MGAPGSAHSVFPIGNAYHGLYVKGLLPIGVHYGGPHGVCQAHHVFVIYPPMGVASCMRLHITHGHSVLTI